MRSVPTQKMCLTDMHILAYTDGSATENGKQTSLGGIGVVFPEYMHLNVSEVYGNRARPPTNNRTELGAVLKAIQVADTIDPQRECELHIKSDSQLTCNTVNDWLHKWKQAGWKKSDGKTPLNLDLLKTLDIGMQGRKLRLQHVRAHTNRQDPDSKYNAMADRLAKSAAYSQAPRIKGQVWTV
jgi:ribonuclease HI